MRLDALTAADLRRALDEGRAQLVLARIADDELAEWQTRYGAAQVIPLYRVPLSYRAVPELTVTARADGWPLAGW